MNEPSWMKPHLRQRLEQERKEATRTGPVNGEKALVAENGKVKEVVTDHKPLPAKDLPMPPKNGWEAIAASESRIAVQEEMARQLREHQAEMLRSLGLILNKKRMTWGELHKNDFRPLRPLDTVNVKIGGISVPGKLMSIGGSLCCVGIESVIGPVFVYRKLHELERAWL